MLQAVIFDFDGVITDSEILHFRTFNTVLAPFEIEISLKDYYKDYLGLSDFDFFNIMTAKGLIKLDPADIEDLVKQKSHFFEELVKTDGKIIEGVCKLLQMLKDHNIPMAICSGALLVEIEIILEEARLRSFFDVVISAEQVKKGKPAPDGFLLTLQKLNSKTKNKILPNQCVVIEDSHWGLEAARTAGMHTIAITNSYDANQLAMAEKIVTRLTELNMENLQRLCT